MGASLPTIAIVTLQTRLNKLRARWGTVGQAKFVLEQAHAQQAVTASSGQRKGAQIRGKVKATVADADFDEYQREDTAYQAAVERIRKELSSDLDLPVTIVDREFIPNFDFRNCAVVVVVGQDGLVANTAKYVGSVPIVGVNPDPRKIDGVLLPFQVDAASRAVRTVLSGRFAKRSVTLAEVNLNDKQRLLAFNDFYIGCSSHTSARYTIECEGASEPQSSSGILVSTGAGSTGWLSSVFNMTSGIARLLGHELGKRPQMKWEDRKLMWAVREPFASRHSKAGLVAGMIHEGHELVIESLMPASGVIFSDGIEADFLAFNSGTIARIGVSQQAAKLVVP